MCGASAGTNRYKGVMFPGKFIVHKIPTTPLSFAYFSPGTETGTMANSLYKN